MLQIIAAQPDDYGFSRNVITMLALIMHLSDQLSFPRETGA
ncbi:hypothetical protein [Morganella morganii IS15]|nr:hypothetical protein [Morganella morganii IS15]